MRKAFTLVEMLIVVVVLVTLMTVTFRLGALNNSSWQRNTTVSRLQRLENCLSGYYAAFGSYPPVDTLGSRNPFLRVDTHGLQSDNPADENENIFSWSPDTFRKGTYQSAEADAWSQVEAACKAQPVGCSFPFPDEYGEVVEAWSEHLKEEAATTKDISAAKKQIFSMGFSIGSGENSGFFQAYSSETSWSELQLFRFGLMSYLLPRFLVMMGADEQFFDGYQQWRGLNDLPSDPFTGVKFTSWLDVKRCWESSNRKERAKVSSIPSQAVCARWMPNLEGIVMTMRDQSVFGLKIKDSSFKNQFSFSTEVYTPGGYNSGGGGQYVLDSCTVVDGWQNDFYYYSPAPYQTYILWSAGPNGRTFPPWISREGLDVNANRCIGAWIEDDIVNMSH